MDEVRAHNRPDDAWMVLSGRVYNIGPYMPFHPGGAQILLSVAGKDGTASFQRYHPWVNGHALLEACLLGSVKVRLHTRAAGCVAAWGRGQGGHALVGGHTLEGGGELALAAGHRGAFAY